MPQEGDEDKIVAIEFSNNGYHLATSNASGIVRAWDLRKQKVLQTLNNSEGAPPCSVLAFDDSGKYLAYGGDKLVQVCVVKDGSSVTTIELKSPVSGIAWGAEFLATSSDKDRKVWFHGEKEEK